MSLGLLQSSEQLEFGELLPLLLLYLLLQSSEQLELGELLALLLLLYL